MTESLKPAEIVSTKSTGPDLFALFSKFSGQRYYGNGNVTLY